MGGRRICGICFNNGGEDYGVSGKISRRGNLKSKTTLVVLRTLKKSVYMFI